MKRDEVSGTIASGSVAAPLFTAEDVEQMMGGHPVVQLNMYRCSSCGATIFESFPMAYSYEAMRPSVPEGWRRVDDEVICGRHVIEVDGEQR